MKKCGFSFKGCSRILVHEIHLHGKMIHYGTKIAYIYVRTPNSNKRYYWNFTPPVGGHSGFLKTYHRVKKDFFWMALKLMFKGLWHNVWFSNKVKWKQLRPQVFYNHYPSQVITGRRFPWISSKDYQTLKEIISSW